MVRHFYDGPVNPHRTRPSMALSLVVVMLAGCSSSGTTAGTSTDSNTNSTPTTVDTSPFGWKEFGASGRVETGHLQVPIDYSNPSKGTFDLYVARHLAVPEKRIGSLLVNPGGPGFGGSDYAIYADSVYGKELLDRFDIVGWDPRGTGLSEPAIDCIDDYDRYFTGLDITPDTDADRTKIVDLSKEFADLCVKKNKDIIDHIGTNESARDIDSIRAALGEAKISYFGFSYGSELGAVWATLFPNTVRAAALDGAADPTANALDLALQQSAGFEQALNTFLARCSSTATCAFHHNGDAEGAFDALMTRLDATPIPTVDGRPDLTRGMALNAVAQAMYSDSIWPDLEKALADADRGDGAAMLQLMDDYFQRRKDGTWDNGLEAFQVISCADSPERPTVAEEDASAAQFQKVAPRFSPGDVGSYFCTFFPPTTDPVVPVTGKGAGPILVMGTTGDPATPLEGTRRMASTLENGRLVVVKAEGHTGYLPDSCSGDVIDAYLVDPVKNVPADGYTCN